MDEARDTGNAALEPAAAGEPARGLARGDRVHAFATPAITVTWSRKRCTHAADCVMNLPTVFAPGRVPWVDATQGSADAVARVVARCPTGALHFERRDGGAPEPVPAANTVLISRDGPVYLRGDIEVRDEAGEVVLRDARVGLCRCGHSRTKPLCDNSHLEAGFRDPGRVSGADGVEDPGAAEGALRVNPRPGGPIELLGAFALRSADGKTMLAGTRAVLCRCGNSQNKPFCDGTHKRVGFPGE
ncbi:MAG TPA: CDGSH iron-sulfur domain-containing protein [Candidatus Eisenbacteria bacterium]|jgi:CDGSH-type Zn-finger protein/uncharacterized Fe-S cluster protein YjdI